MSNPMLTTVHQRVDQVLQLVDREIWIVTAAANGRATGLVATWASAASIDPRQPMVVIGLAPNHFTTELITASGGFALHLLARRHLDLVWRFGLASGRATDKFAGLSYHGGLSESPILADCLAWLDCRVVDQYDAGDRLYFWADVVDGLRLGDHMPLREREVLSTATRDQLAGLREGRKADIAVLAPLRETWLRRVMDR